MAIIHNERENKNMMKIFKSLSIIIAVLTIAGLSTLSYFNSESNSTPNTFSAGTLDAKIRNDNSMWDSGATGTWVSPDSWAPGEEVTGTIHMTNLGTVDSKHVYFKFLELSHNSPVDDGSNLMDKITVSSIVERFNEAATPNQALFVASQIGNKDSVLTLKELVEFTGGYYSIDDQSNDKIILEAGNKQDYDIIITFKFDESAGNEYQGDTCGFSLNMTATQNSSTDGMIRI